MAIGSSKLFGEIGALLMVVSPFAGAPGSVLGLAGLVLLLVAFNGLANHYQDRRIFNNVLYGGIAFVVGAAVAIVIVITAAVGLLSVIGIPMSSWTNPTAWQAIDWQSFTNWAGLAPYIGAIVVALIVLFALAVVAAILFRRSLGTLAQKSGITMFGTSGLLFLIGAVLTIIIIGFLLIWVAEVLLLVAFFELRSEAPGSSTPQPA